MPVFTVTVQEKVTALYKIEAASADQAEEEARLHHEEGATRCLLGCDVEACDVSAKAVF